MNSVLDFDDDFKPHEECGVLAYILLMAHCHLLMRVTMVCWPYSTVVRKAAVLR